MSSSEPTDPLLARDGTGMWYNLSANINDNTSCLRYQYACKSVLVFTACIATLLYFSLSSTICVALPLSYVSEEDTR